MPNVAFEFASFCNRPYDVSKALPLGEAFASDFSWMCHVTCQFAPLLHCDLHESDMSRKERDAFRCTGAGIRESDTFVSDSIGISVRRVVF